MFLVPKLLELNLIMKRDSFKNEEFDNFKAKNHQKFSKINKNQF